MKKLLQSSLALLLFALAMVIFQISCSKEAGAHDDDNYSNNNGGNGQKVLYKRISADQPASTELWLMNSNGTNRRKVNINLPAADIYIETARLVDGGTRIVFFATKLNETDNFRIAYRCNVDGSNLTQLFQGAQFEHYEMHDVY